MDNHIKLYDMEVNKIPERYSGPYFLDSDRFYTYMDSIITVSEAQTRESHMSYDGDSHYFTDTKW